MTNWDQQYCPTCGAGQVSDAYFCGNCGTSFQPAEPIHRQADPYAGYEAQPSDAAYLVDDSRAAEAHYVSDPSTWGPTDDPAWGSTADSPTHAVSDSVSSYEPYDPYALPGEADQVPPLMPETAGAPGPGSAAAGDTSSARARSGAERRAAPLLAFAGVLIVAVTAGSPALLAADDEDSEDEAPAGAVNPADVADDQVLLHPVEEVPEGALFPDGAIDVAQREDEDADLSDINLRVVSLPPHAATRSESTASLSELVVSGTEDGAYSGLRRAGVCDSDALLAGVTGAGTEEESEGDGGDEADAEADESAGTRESGLGAATADEFAAALSLESSDELEGYIDGLTAVRLRLDTRVTHHSVVDGAVVPVQVILQAGTGVLIDATGVPRVSCNGGNPLSPPAPLEDAPSEDEALDIEDVAANHGAAWDRLDPERVVTIEPGAESIEQVLFADMDTTELIERPTGTNGNRDMGPGDLSATLAWDSPADLDLSVVDPNEATVSAERPSPENSKGRLTEDANRQCQENMVGEEQISWPDGDAPEGAYTISVSGHAVGAAPADAEDAEYEADCGGDAAEFKLTVKLYGQEPVVHEESVKDSETKDYSVTLGEPSEEAGGGNEGEDAAGDE